MQSDTRKSFSAAIGVSDQLYSALKQEIVTNVRAPGERLQEVAISQQYGLSRTPVREALKRLEQDGLVERIPQGGVQVTEISPIMISEVFGIRRVLEVYAIELACEKVTAPDIEHLREVVVEAEAATICGDLRKSTALNTKFHDIIYAIPENATLLKAVSVYVTMALRFRSLSMHDKDFLKDTWGEHTLITNALEKRDKAEAMALVRAHVAKGEEAAFRCYQGWARRQG